MVFFSAKKSPFLYLSIRCFSLVCFKIVYFHNRLENRNKGAIELAEILYNSETFPMQEENRKSKEASHK